MCNEVATFREAVAVLGLGAVQSILLGGDSYVVLHPCGTFWKEGWGRKQVGTGLTETNASRISSQKSHQVDSAGSERPVPQRKTVPKSRNN